MRPVRSKYEDGFTLVELLITMSILSVVMALITGSAIYLQRSINETDQRYDDLGQAQVGLEATTKWLRNAITVDPYTQPFTLGKRSEVIVMANVGIQAGDPPRLVGLRVVAGDLEERMWTGTIDASGNWKTASSTPRTRIIAHGVTQPLLFTYFDADGTDITPATDRDLTESERKLVRRVGISITVQQSPAVDVPPSQLSNRVVLPNQFYLDTEGVS